MTAVTTAICPLTLNGTPVSSVRFLFFWKGVWVADVELAQDGSNPLTPFVPSGPAVLVINAQTLTGTIDPRGSGTFSNKTSARVVGGMGGWDKAVPPKHFNAPNGGLLSTIVYSTTAALVGEPPPLDPTPINCGTDYPRIGGPAREMFADRDWYVDPITGIANVSAWPPAVPDVTLQILDFEPSSQTATLACQALVLPGTVLVDPRFNGNSPTIRTVEQYFDSNGSTVTAWCSANPVERFTEAFTLAVRIAADTAHLKVYQYRFVLPATGSDLALQAITPGAPDLNPIHQYQALSGSLNKYAPSTILFVGFTADTPPQPYLITASPLATPLQIDLAASVEASIDAPEVNIGASKAVTIDVGGSSTEVAIAGGESALTVAPWALALAQGLALVATALSSNPSTESAAAAAGTALTSLLAGLPPPATTNTKAT